ncbi:hypothetical protein A3SI_14379 [Nitritalea halalkaliphila LW7]|uniref:Tetracyclin repressor-like C-terminal domain-containing protein n=1 Tax=Nitritalea halalkaliphila LW7 TaxID=1189621 RepID=I5BZV0_9BACT|nr:TetR family transcriptional regulator C-terminal domain-containing protein [Nitritalea halalkaliphila]EIM75102.1 hypothetical protein A3SI_14379 [Nitritalea halalkaliphila LW7]
MENTTAQQPSTVDPRTAILNGYVLHVLEEGKEPASMFKFAKSLDMQESDIYTYFTSFTAIKSAVWVSIYDATLKQLEEQEVYATYSAREKLLGFLFTIIEEWKKNRSYLLSLYGHDPKALKQQFPEEVKAFKGKFRDFANELILEGKETDEIASRPVISDRYADAMWFQLWFVFRFWIKDTSPGFEKTDAAIEKSVNLAFDLMGKSAVDTFIDFVKFMYQSK